MEALKQITYRSATIEDIPAVSALQNSMYEIKRSDDFHLWLCFETVVPSVLMCAFCGDEMIGFFGMQKRTLTNGAICGQAGWLNIAPKWRNRGCFTKLGHLAIDSFTDLDVLCVLANKNARSACERAFGFRTIGTLDMLVLGSFSSVTESDTICRPVTEETVFPSPRKSGRPHMVEFENSQEYRLWRYGLNPMYSYSVVGLASGEFAVVKIFVEPTTKEVVGDIVDVECDLGSVDRLCELINGACWHLKNRGARKITVWATPGTQLRTAVERMGFAKSGYETHFCLKSLKPECDSLYDFSKWYLRQADATNY